MLDQDAYKEIFRPRSRFLVKVMFLIILVVVLTSSLLSGYALLKQRERLHEALIKQGTAHAESLELAIGTELAVGLALGEITPEDRDKFSEACSEIAEKENVFYVIVIDTQGIFLAGSENWDIVKAYIPREISQKAIAVEKDTIVSSFSDYRGQLIYEIDTPIFSMGKEKIAAVRLGMTTEDIIADFKRQIQGMFLITLCVVFGALFFAFVFVRTIVNPIKLLTTATLAAKAGDLTQHVEVKTNDEIGLLANSFNEMTQALRKSRDELISAQSQLMQSAKMAAVGELAAGVAHELNNPLGGILGYAQYTKEKIDKKKDNNPTPEDINIWSQYLGFIERESQRCKRIVQNLLKFARASRVEFEPVDINAVLDETFVFVEHQLAMHKVKLDKDLGAGLPMIPGNANHLQQVFTNIILNGQQAMADGGELKVSSRHIVGTDEGTGRVEVEIRDNGCGIPEENLSKIFDPFFTTKKVGEGTGLGLSISYGIVKDHGGEIKVESAVDRGTTFIISIPQGREDFKNGKDKNNVIFSNKITGKP